MMTAQSAKPLISDKPALLVGGGGVTPVCLAAIRALAAKGFAVAAADSGADILRHAGITPALIAGDLDSLSSREHFPQSRVIETPDQDKTDFEKTLALIDAPLVAGFGFLGKRMDHALSALHVLARLHDTAPPVMIIGAEDVVFFMGGGSTAIILQLDFGARVSIWPLGAQVFAASQGLEYPLDGIELRAGGMVGTSNRVIAKDGQCSIIPDKGGGFFILLERKHCAAATGLLAPQWRDCIGDAVTAMR